MAGLNRPLLKGTSGALRNKGKTKPRGKKSRKNCDTKKLKIKKTDKKKKRKWGKGVGRHATLARFMN